MDIVKIFVRDNCPKCPVAKKIHLDLVNGPVGEIADIQAFNVGEASGLAEASMYMVATAPAILVCDGDEDVIREWRSDMPPVGEIESLLHSRAHERIEHAPAP